MLIPLIQNETLKIIRRKRFAVVIAILFAIIALVTYGQYRRMRDQRNRNWRAEVQQTVAQYQNMLRRGRVSETWARSIRADINRLQFYLDHDIEPNKPTAPLFVRTFANVAGFLLLPLLIGILGSDIVSAENSEGTDKLLLTRPVRRWKVLTAKLMTLWLFSTLTLFCGAILAYSVSAPFLPRGGWAAPTFTGFSLGKGALQIDAVRQLPLWKDTLIAYGLEWFALLTVACIALLLSVLFRSSAAAIGTMLASLIGGTILTRVSPEWTAGKYLFVSALPLADYYTGEPPPYDGMSMMFCIALLGAWAIVAITISYAVFTRRDVFG
ncbi:MAG: type transport system permease protein [Thermoanaerobaculia bacterium]|jgi:ABC-2 type transport system permease protein|nr:type transport system permease protein [Thermoanaerobaculia bacterium]